MYERIGVPRGCFGVEAFVAAARGWEFGGGGHFSVLDGVDRFGPFYRTG